jgi:hypothetical protein
MAIKHWIGLGLAVPLAAGLGACGASGSSGTPSSGGTTSAAAASDGSSAPTPSTAPRPTAAKSPAPAPAPAPASGSSAIPSFEPSTVISQSAGHTQLSSPEGVAKVTAFYDSVLSKGGWSISSSAKTSTSSNFVVRRSGHGGTVSLASAGPAGTSISISTYAQ